MDVIENSQTPQPAQPVPVEPKKKSKALLIAILLIAILLVGAGGVYAGMQLIKNKLPSGVIPQPAVPTSTPMPYPIEITQAPISDETSNWKTYTNTKYGFEFKYPHSSETSLEKTVEGEDYLKVKKGIIFIIEPATNSVQKCKEGMCPSINKTETVVFNGVQFEKITATPPEDQPFNGKVPTIFYFETKLKGSKIAQFSFSVTDRNNLQALNEVKALADQILSTFKFLD